MNQSWTVTIEADENGDVILPFPPELIKTHNWQAGDKLGYDIKDDHVIIVNLSAKQRELAQGLD